MRKLIYLLMAIIVFSCNNKNEPLNDVLNSEADYEIDEEILEKEISDISEEKSFSQQKLINEKLQELYELIELKNNHPEFAESIKSRLEKYTEDTIILEEDNVSIKNIELKDEIIRLSDSVEIYKLYYDIYSSGFLKKDSIHAFVSTKKISVDGEIKTSKKIKFQTIKL